MTIAKTEHYGAFSDHLEALSRTFTSILAVIALGAAISFIFHSTVISFLTAPFTNMHPASSPVFEEKFDYIRLSNSSDVETAYQLPKNAPIIHTNFEIGGGKENIAHQQTIVNIPPGGSLVYGRPSPLSSQLVVLGPLEGILIAIKTSLWMGAVATSPLWLLFLFQFISPALKINERRLVLPFLLTSLLFIALGALFAFLVTIPIANHYLASFSQTIALNLWSLERYLDYTLFLLLANGLAFELCAIGLFMVYLGIVSHDQLRAWRKGAIVAAFILGALLTPPDVLTQFMLAVPLIFLYEGLILFAKAMKRYTEDT